MWNENSWHYRLVSFYATGGDLTWYQKPQDFCTYLRKMCRGLFNVGLLFTLIYFIFLKPLGHVIPWIVASIQYGTFLSMDDQTQGFFIAMAVITVLAFIAWISYLIVEHYENKAMAVRNKKKIAIEKDLSIENKQNFFSMAWSKFHDKTCFPIDYSDD